MKFNNFHGLKDFVWWVGVIEDRIDPLGMGRCKVRIFGYHSDDILTEDLPWSHPLLPINNSKSHQSPTIGDWVMGFFMDGETGQFPIMMGVLPGLR